MRRSGWGAVVFVGAIVAAGLASPPSASFSDVAEDDWFAPSVAWLAESGLTTGTAPGCYQPEQFLTRAQTATFLHRLAETPDASAPLPFDDVTAPWAVEAVRWLAEEGITVGVAPGRFAPDAFVTRGQFAAFLHRFAGRPAASAHPFDDVVSAYQQEPVAWLAAAGITTGTGPRAFSPDDYVTRAQLAVFLHRYVGRPAADMPFSPPCERPIVVHAVGDVNFDPGYGPNPQYPFSHAWSGLDGLFLRDDLSIINLECAPSELGSAVPKTYNFRCPLPSLAATAAAGVDVANLANNHGGDYGIAALLDGVANVRSAGIASVGAGVDLAAATAPARFEVNGVRIAVLGFNAVGSSWRAGPGVAGMADGNIETMTAAVRAADEDADVVLVAIHWGVERMTVPAADDIPRARALIDAGADAVFGHHPHVLQPLEYYRDRPIFWSLGNFVWHAGTKTTAVARVTIEPDGRVTGSMLPARIVHKGHPVLLG